MLARALISGMVQPKAGFKRYYKSLGGEFPQPSLVKSYSQRRAERLERYDHWELVYFSWLNCCVSCTAERKRSVRDT